MKGVQNQQQQNIAEWTPEHYVTNYNNKMAIFYTQNMNCTMNYPESGDKNNGVSVLSIDVKLPSLAPGVHHSYMYFLSVVILAAIA